MKYDRRRAVFTRVALALLNARPISALAHDGALDKTFLDQIQKLSEHIVREADTFARKELMNDVVEENTELLHKLRD